MKKISRKWSIIISVILFLIITNPSLKTFKEDTGYSNGKREYNFLLFSIFKSDKYHFDIVNNKAQNKYLGTEYYLGIALNTFNITRRKV